jgi:hypothetical protein
VTVCQMLVRVVLRVAWGSLIRDGLSDVGEGGATCGMRKPNS